MNIIRWSIVTITVVALPLASGAPVTQSAAPAEQSAGAAAEEEIQKETIVL